MSDGQSHAARLDRRSNRPPFALGFDPGTKCSALALAVQGPGRILEIHVFTAPNAPAMETALGRYLPARRGERGLLVTEGQQFYTDQPQATAASLLPLAALSGYVRSWGHRQGLRTRCPLPVEWKGSIAKRVHQAQILKAMGWEHELHKGLVYRSQHMPKPFVPEGITVRRNGREIAPNALTPQEEFDVIDACGLARWGLTRG